MNARLSSLLVAGGVVLAGIHTGSLHASPALEAAARKAVLVSTSMEADGPGAKVFLRVTGMTSQPGVQVLANPHRVVLDLHGVDRGTTVTRKDLAQLAHPLILKTRLAQFATDPKPVTRLVLEVAPGTQVLVGSSPEGVQLHLTPGEGRVQARFDGAIQPILLPAAAVELAAMTTAPAAAIAPLPEKAAPRPLAALPAVGGSFQLLPQLAVSTALPVASPEAVQTPEAEKPHAQAPAPSRAGGRTLGEGLTKYSGSKITIDLQNTEIRDFLRILADTGKLNLVMDPDVQGNFGFKFTDTPWDQVLDVVLKNAGLGKEIQNGVLRVAKVDKLQKEEEERKKLDETKALAGELQTITRPLSYAKVSEVQKILKDMLTKRGSAILDDRTNTLIITDLPRNISVIDDLLQTLDVQIQQVQIEARVVEANKNWQREFGVKWPQSNNGSVAITSGSTSTGTPWVGSSSPFWNGVQGFNRPASGQDASIAWSPGKDGATSITAPAGELWLSFLSNRFSINAVLQAMEKDGTLKIVSSPKVVTQNNKKATILSGQKIPYPTQQGGAQGGAITVAFIDANLQLDVTPQITSEGTIIMDLKIEKAEADFTRTVQGTPTILRKAIETQVLVRDGGTAVLGGVYITSTSTGTTGVPFLSKIPLIGFLFRNDTKQDQNVELLIFITPRVLRQ
ncbi:MAG: type IV pilus secretin PilQ [Geothrix sp.]|uniref:type IV pilus secretin PilQ n=1 Tax=Geothrix sp. TaxID=1962974 RepID=UPI0017C9DBA5|nr:type IV pilus secretin PilQ [Geothrix sp.]NWJ39885.1 type IV pilus secretin PilQ [Geothrix sp.]WIL22102.1 MAG: type IV pilus secretin PilQ [Geothrix sp.]